MTTEYAQIRNEYSMDKIFVTVTAIFSKDGKIKPIMFEWEDQNVKINRLLDVMPAAATKQGGSGFRYTCLVGGKQFHLFFDSVRWFIVK